MEKNTTVDFVIIALGKAWETVSLSFKLKLESDKNKNNHCLTTDLTSLWIHSVDSLFGAPCCN